MILKPIGIASALTLLGLSTVTLAQTSSSATSSGSAEMGRGRCEALIGAEREKCQTGERASGAAAPATQRSDERK
jgi:hypothetical protein